jgi:hypothetical protein
MEMRFTPTSRPTRRSRTGQQVPFDEGILEGEVPLHSRSRDLGKQDASFSARKRVEMILGAALALGMACFVTTSFHLSFQAASETEIFLHREIISEAAQEHKDPALFYENTTYTDECRNHYLKNSTWGKLRAPFVDKDRVKYLVQSMNSTVRIIPTLATYNKDNLSNFTEATLESLPDSFIIKPSHTTGSVARFDNGTYNCFKQCNFNFAPKTPEGSVSRMKENMKHIIKGSRYIENLERQYKYIKPNIIIEEHLPMEGMLEYHWWIVNGHPVFVCIRCNEITAARGSYFSSRFEQLNVTSSLEPCENLRKPSTWDEMQTIVRQLGKHIDGIVRLDLYANDEAVWFSEFTFSSASCRGHFKPLAADALLYNVLHNRLGQEMVTPQFVEAYINQMSWVLVDMDSLTFTQGAVASSDQYPSLQDLCQDVVTATNGTSEETRSCYRSAAQAESYPLRCVSKKDGELTAVGQMTKTTLETVMDRVDWPWVIMLGILLVGLASYRIGEKQRRHQYWNVLLYLLCQLVYKCLKPSFQGLFSPDSVVTTIVESVKAFTIVHPMSSQLVVISHLGTYWTEIAAWRAKSLKMMLFWYFMFELATSFVNELSHHMEDDIGVRCTRVMFVYEMKHYAIDDMIRAYLLSPFLVYGYLLPKFVCHCLFSIWSLIARIILGV